MRDSDHPSSRQGASSGMSGESPHGVMSFAQERLWFIEQLEPGTSVYNVVSALRLRGPLDTRLLQGALTRIIARHEPLRSVFDALDGEPFVRLLASDRCDWAFEDLSNDPKELREQRLRDRLSREGRRTFDLSSDRMLRARLYRLAPMEHVLLLVMHHIATDGWSTQLLVRELAALYNAGVRGESADVPQLPMRYSDYAKWQRERLHTDTFERNLTYWRNKLGGAPQGVNLPLDRARPSEPDARGGRVSASIDASTLGALKRLARVENATLFMVVLALLMVILQRYSGQEDLCVGAPVAGRMHPDCENLVGFFVNMLVFRERIRGAETFREFLRRVRNTCLDAYEHQEMPFEQLVAKLPAERLRNRSPLFQVMLSVHSDAMENPQLDGLSVTRMPLATETAKFDLDVFVQASQEGLEVCMVYPTSLFEAATIERIVRQFCHLCQAIGASPNEPVASIPLAPAEEALVQFEALNRTGTPYPRDSTVSKEFRAMAARRPEAVAVRQGRRGFTYRLLDKHSDRFASELLKLGTRPGDPVAVHAPRSPEMIVALLGILKAGAGYVCLDPRQPEEWLAQIVDSARPRLIVSAASVPSALLRDGRRVVQSGSRSDAVAPPDVASAPGLAWHHVYLGIEWTCQGGEGLSSGCAAARQGAARDRAWTRHTRASACLSDFRCRDIRDLGAPPEWRRVHSGYGRHSCCAGTRRDVAEV